MILDFFDEKMAIFGPFLPDFPISQISREFPGLAKLELGFPGLKKHGKLQTLLKCRLHCIMIKFHIRI